MKAILVNNDTQGLYIAKVNEPILKENEIKVKVKSTAVNRADIYQRIGQYPPPEGESDILGLEMSGVVCEVGEAVNNLQLGDRVYSLLSGGGYAEYVVINANNVMKIPDNMTFEEAASIPEAFLTAFLNLKLIADVKENEYVLIHAGASGVGTAAIQVARELGAQTIVTAGTSEKLEKCKELGADHVINYKSGKFSEEVLNITGKGVQVILDFIGASFWENNIKSIRAEGRWILLGLLGGSTLENINLSTILQKNINLVGSTLRSKSNEFKMELTKKFEEFAKERFEKEKFSPVMDKVYNWRDVETAHKYMKSNNNIGKIVLRVD